MFGPPRPQVPHMRWGNRHPPHIPHWRHPTGPRHGPPPAPYHGHQRFNHPRLQFSSGNDNYWCETCDRGFPTEDILNKHKQQHQKCNIDGCQFIAHPKVITKHIQMQHSTGLYKKIANLKNPEEIAKWREERRKRYPTKANIDKKVAELKEKIDRGEKMGLERDRNRWNKPNSEQDNMPGQGIKRKFPARNESQPKSKFQRNNRTDQNKNPQSKAKPKLAPIVAEDKRLKPFAGILNMQMDSDNEIENDTAELNDLIEDEDHCDDSKTENVEIIPEKIEPVVCGALSSLMCDYGSSEEEDNSGTVVVDSKNTTQSSKDIPTRISNVSVLKCVAEENKESIILGETVHIDGKANVTNRHKAETNKGCTDVVHQADQNKDDRSDSLKEKAVIKGVTITSTPTDDEEIHNDNSNDSRPKEVKTELSKPTSTLDDSGNIKCDYEIKKDLGQETIHNDDDSDSGPEEIKVEVTKEDTSILEEPKPANVRKKIIKGRMQVNQWRRPKLPSTLLQKLLSKEMQHERNIILQCIRYVRRNNYFDKQA